MKSIEWICVNCGQRRTMTVSAGRPLPGTCPRTKGRAHRWTKNRTIGK